MGKDQFQAPVLATLLKNGTSLAYSNKNPERLYLVQQIQHFHHHLAELAANKKAPEAHLADLAIDIRILSLEVIHQDPYRQFPLGMHLGSQLTATLLKQCEIKSFNEISLQRRFIGLVRLFEFINTHDYKGKDAHLSGLIQHKIKDTYKRVEALAENIIHAIPTEKALDEFLLTLDSAYELAKKSGQPLHPTHMFLAELGAIIARASTEKELVKESTHLGLNRSWRLKIGAVMLIMLAIEKEYIVRSPRGNSALYDLCVRGLTDLKRIDAATQHSCLATLKNFLNDYKKREQIETIGRAHYLSKQLHNIDAALVPYEKLLDDALKTLNKGPESIYPSFTLALSILGALLLASPGAGLGEAAGKTIAEMDILVPFLTNMSKFTREVMVKTVGPSGKNMAYKASELVTSCSLAHGFSHLCQAAFMFLGGVSGAVVGTSLDFSLDGLLALRKHAKLDPVMVRDEDLQFVVALLKAPNILSEQQRNKIKNNTQGLLSAEKTAHFSQP